MKYYTLRSFDSNVHVFEFDPKIHDSSIEFGVTGKYEQLSTIHNPTKLSQGYSEIAKINLGFFGGTSEHNGLTIVDGKVNGSANNKACEAYLTKDGRFVVGSLTDAEVSQLKDIQWCGTLSYSLLINGQKQFIGAENYSHFNQRNPRTLIGQKADLTMCLVVVEGRSNQSKGVTGEQSADILLGLNCVQGINADGGGSSELIHNGKIMNALSDGKERSIGSALIVYKKDITIALCDGHGISTLGKRTPTLPDGLKSEIGLPYMNENLFNRAVVNYLKVELERCGFKTLLVAPTDDDTPLEARTKLANDKKVDLYLSIHANASAGKWFDGGGIETFSMPTGEGKKLADLIHKHVMNGTPFKDRGVKDGSHLWVIKKTNMPSVLMELGFMDSNQDYVHLLKEEYRKECAIEICKGVCEYYGLPYVEEVVTQPTYTPKPDKVETPPAKVIEGDEIMKVTSPALRAIVEAELRDLTDSKRYGKEAFSTIWLDKFLKNELTVSDAVALLYAAKRKGI